MKVLVTATIITLAAGVASASGFPSVGGGQGCGPSFNISASDTHTDSTGRAMSRSENVMFSIGLNFKIGQKKACEEQAARQRDIHLRDIRKSESQAIVAEVDALSKRIAFCVALPYTLEDAPNSVLELCSEFLPESK